MRGARPADAVIRCPALELCPGLGVRVAHNCRLRTVLAESGCSLRCRGLGVCAFPALMYRQLVRCELLCPRPDGFGGIQIVSERDSVIILKLIRQG